MTDHPIDFGPLDPTADGARYDRAVDRIMDAAALPLARRRARLTPVGQVSRWWRPLLAMAAAVVLAAVGVLTQVAPAAAAGETPSAPVAEALGIPSSVAAWMAGGDPPTVLDAVGRYEEGQ